MENGKWKMENDSKAVRGEVRATRLRLWASDGQAGGLL